ncbi:glucose 1-dehydrogenase [Serratia quinivorans]|uniref:SDR family NAD(P)-dependent oxidoreductase n=1 Tax=Serratia TaxID=613 RepID=UPI002E77D7EF|nr:glucose 1-dehydrogenase [Serratia quinivorans]
MKRFKNKIALITGSSKGIGAAIAKRLSAEGAIVFINYSRGQDDANRLVKEINQQGGIAFPLQANVAIESEVNKLLADIIAQYGRVDVLVNNAGVYATGSLEEFNAQEYERHFNLNVKGLIYCTRAAVNAMPEAGGSIVNISSSVTSFTPANSMVYTASKAAVDAITKTLANELGKRNIRVNAVNPGLVVTEGVHDSGFFNSDFKTHIESVTPLGRIGTPQDIAPAVAYLASDEASWVTGECLIIGGGLH